MNIGDIFSAQNYWYGKTGNPSGQSSFSLDSGLTNQSVSGKKHVVFMKTEDMLYSGGNGTGLSFFLKYAEGSTEDNPVVIAEGIDENGNKFEQTINVNEVDPKNATLVEMRALEAVLNVNKRGGLTSFSQSMTNLGLNDRGDFMSAFQKDVEDQALLGERQNALFYLNNMRTYYDFIYKL